jgi:hypothetical protein
MTDREVERILAEDRPVAAVLLSRGGWLRSLDDLVITCRFPADDKGPALWQIDLMDASESAYYRVFVQAETIVGISVHRSSS